MIRLKFYLKVLTGLPKSLYINLKYFGPSGWRLPIIVTWRTRLTEVKGSVLIKGRLSFGILRLGFSSVALSSFHEWNVWNVNGQLEINGRVDFGSGSKLFIGPHGSLVLGDNVLITACSEIICDHCINVEKDALISWNVLLMDTDAHPIRDHNNNIINPNRQITVGENVWIGCRTVVLKGAEIAKNSIVAANSTVNKIFTENNVVIGGAPAKIIKRDIVWKREHF